MALVVNNVFVTEPIVDTGGTKLGELKFNPNDSRIMGKLSKIVNDLSEALKIIKKVDNNHLSTERLKTLEDFENASADIEKMCSAIDAESKAVDSAIKDLEEVFGKETIKLFTGGTSDIETLIPILEFVMPYVKRAREKKVSQYMPKSREESEVLE